MSDYGEADWYDWKVNNQKPRWNIDFFDIQGNWGNWDKTNNQYREDNEYYDFENALVAQLVVAVDF